MYCLIECLCKSVTLILFLKKEAYEEIVWNNCLHSEPRNWYFKNLLCFLCTLYKAMHIDLYLSKVVDFTIAYLFIAFQLCNKLLRLFWNFCLIYFWCDFFNNKNMSHFTSEVMMLKTAHVRTHKIFSGGIWVITVAVFLRGGIFGKINIFEFLRGGRGP